MTTWNDFTATLSEQDHTHLVLALGALLEEARQVAEVAARNGSFDDVRRHMIAAGKQWRDAGKILFPEEF